MTYVGHATVVIDLDGVRVITDPVLRPRVLHLRRVGSVPASALRGLDAVLLSHAHWDHLDVPSLERLGKELPIVCPGGVSGLLRRKKFRHVTTLEVGEDVQIGRLAVSAVHAEHEGARGPLGASGQLGYVVSGCRRIYFAGDTDLFDDLADVGPSTWRSFLSPAGAPRSAPDISTPSVRPRRFRLLQPRWPSPFTGAPGRASGVSRIRLAARVREARRRRGAGGRGETVQPGSTIPLPAERRGFHCRAGPAPCPLPPPR